MSEKQRRPSLRFCPGCGTPAPGSANYCMSCGAALRPSGGGGPGYAAPPGGTGLPAQRLGLAVLGVFLTVGLVLWFLILRPTEEGRLPLAKSQGGADEGAPGATTQASLPANHPPLEIPPEAKSFLAGLEKKAADSPDNVENWKTLAQTQYRAGQIDRSYLAKAEASYRRVLELDAKNLEALRGLGNIHFDREEYPEAVKSYSGYLELKPDDSNVRTDLGTMYLYSGQDEKAIGEYKKVVEKNPGFYQAHFNLGVAYSKKGDRVKAAETLEKAKSLAPDDRTREQIQAMIDRSKAQAGVAPSGIAAAAEGVQGAVEEKLRSHPIVGPKIVKFEWSTPTAGRVVLDNFPMSSMPEFARGKFLDRLKTDLGAAKSRSGASGAVKLDLVDRASGEVMATVSSE